VFPLTNKKLWQLIAIFLLSLPPKFAVGVTQGSGSHPEDMLKQGKAGEALPLLLQIHLSQPNNAQVCLQIGIAYTELQQLAKAAEFYRKALKINPHFLAARRNLATVLWFLSQKAESEREFLVVLKARPDDSVAHLYLGSLEYERQQFAKAKQHFEKAGDLALQNPEALPMVLESYLATQDMTLPGRLLRQLQQAENPNPELIFHFGVLFGRYEHYDESIKAFEKIRENYPDHYALLLNLGMAQLHGQQFKPAIQNFEKIVALNLAKPEVYLLLGEGYDKQGMPEKAYSAYAKAIEMDSKSEEGYIALSNFSSAHHNLEFALKTLDRGLQQIPGSARLLLQQGIIWALADNVAEAEQSFEKASRSDTGWSLPVLALGITQLQAGKLTEAAATFREAAKKAPDDYRPEYFYALTLSRAGARGDVARRGELIAALRRAIVLNPNDADSRVSLGQTYLAADQLDAAVAELEKAIELDPKNPAALYQLGIAYRKQGKAEAAQHLLRTFEETKAKLKEEEDQERKALVQILKTVRAKQF
jgi:superkiller protein 3